MPRPSPTGSGFAGSNDCDRPAGRVARSSSHRTSSSPRSARRPRSRRRSTVWARRSSSACCPGDAAATRARALRTARDRPIDAAPGAGRAGQSGHLHATRGRGGGTFVADPQPPAAPPSPRDARAWRETCDQRLAVELGVAVLAAERAEPGGARRARRAGRGARRALEDFPAYRQADIRLHVGLAEATGSPRLVTAMTEMQGAMTGLISLHRPPARGARLVECPAPPAAGRAARARRGAGGPGDGRAHSGTEQVLAGLLPDAADAWTAGPSDRAPQFGLLLLTSDSRMRDIVTTEGTDRQTFTPGGERMSTARDR